MLGTEVMPGRLDSSLRLIDIKLSVSRSSRLHSRLLLVDELINSIGLSGLHPTLPNTGPPRAGRPITGVRLKGSQANAHAGGAPNARPGRARPLREARVSPPTRAPTSRCGPVAHHVREPGGMIYHTYHTLAE